MVENENPMADNEVAGILRRTDLVKPHLRFKIFNAAERERRDLNRLKPLELSLLQRKRSKEKKERAFGSRERRGVAEQNGFKKEVRRN